MTTMPPGGPAGGGTAERLLREYRAFLRESHPDRGGDPEEFAARLADWRAALAVRPATDGSPRSGRQAVAEVHRITAYRRGPWPIRCGRALAAAVRRRRRTRVR